MANNKRIIEKIPQKNSDRRILIYAPDPLKRRNSRERRGAKRYTYKKGKFSRDFYDFGTRYKADFLVLIQPRNGRKISATASDISSDGILVRVWGKDLQQLLTGDTAVLRFDIPEGLIREDYQHNRVRIKAAVIRHFPDQAHSGYVYVAFEFENNLSRHFRRTRWASEILVSSVFLGIVMFLIALLRVDSIVYFKKQPVLYGYSLFTVIYLTTRYFIAAFYKPVGIDPEYTPGISIIIPCFNEETFIQKTIISCLDQEYPLEKLEVIVVDDCSSDHSADAIRKIAAELNEKCAEYDIKARLKCVFLKENQGKRGALAEGAKHAVHELISFVDSDSFLEPLAIRNLVQPFKDPKIGGVTGRTDVENTWTNYLTKMQAVRYYIAFRIMKAAESVFDAVTCLSGPISAYRKSLLEKYIEPWMNQKFLGVQATFGDDRSMTNYILQHNRTAYQDTAICKTIVPSNLKSFLKQQMRWKRSWLRETIRGGLFMWKKEPLHAYSFYAGFLVPLFAPIVVVYNLVFIPITRHLLPIVFISGVLLMSFLMSFIYLLLRRSRIWLYGLWFCLFYEGVLLWQMPVAWVTFWKKPGAHGTQKKMYRIGKRENGGVNAGKNGGREKMEKRRGNNAVSSADSLPEEIAEKNKKKIIRTIIQLIVFFGLILFGLNQLLFPKQYQEPDKTEWTQRDGFIAISYVGVARKSNFQLVSRDELDAHLSALHEAGYVTIGIDDIIAFYEDGAGLPEKALYIMFEDGRRDSYIFAEGLLKRYNDKATMMNYAHNVEDKDDIFVKKRDLRSMEKSTYWENGTNGYRFSYINVKEGKDLEDIDADGDYNKSFFEYNHYLMDFLRDTDGIPVESETKMTERIGWDYQRMEEIYGQAIGYTPRVYTIMHADGLFNSVPEAVEAANLSHIYPMFDLMFNQEGSCYNQLNRNPYNLTRMIVSPDWSVNRLIMEIENYTDSKTPFVTGADSGERLETYSGVANITDKDITLTSEPKGEAYVRLKGTDGWGNLNFSCGLGGRETGTQTILFRENMDSYIRVSVEEYRLIITEKAPGKEENRLYDNLLPGAESIQDVNDTFDLARIDEQTAYYDTANAGDTDDIRKRTMASGLEQIIWDVEVAIKDETMLVWVNGSLINKEAFRVDPDILPGSVALKADGGNEAYDGVFIELNTKPLS